MEENTLGLASPARVITAVPCWPSWKGGRATALAACIEAMPTYIAGLLCAVNINVLCGVDGRNITKDHLSLEQTGLETVKKVSFVS